jgi:hypothetical protein
MSVWYNSQNKPSIDFRKLLQERLDKVNPRRKLAKDETTKLAKLEGIAEKLKRGENVQSRQPQTWLSEDEYAQTEVEWQEQLALREELKDKPSDLKRYEEKLKEAIMMRNRADAYYRQGKKAAASLAAAKCESLCEDALEVLQEIVTADASLKIWFDRNLDFGHGNLPRLVTSRSIDKQHDDSRIVKRLDVKTSVVERAIDNICRAVEPMTSSAKLKLNKFLQIDD